VLLGPQFSDPAHGVELTAAQVPVPLHCSVASVEPTHVVPHATPEAVCSHVPPDAHLPSFPHGGFAPHCPEGAAVPGVRFVQKPFAEPVSAIEQPWQVPVHAELQQKPSTQKSVAH
jgi:hypothetical protein